MKTCDCNQGRLPCTCRQPSFNPNLCAPYGLSGQATRNADLDAAALATARLRAQVSDDLRQIERRTRRIYQLLALLGWATVVVMGVVL